MHIATSPAFKENAHEALGNAGLQKALARSGPSFIARRAAAVAALPEFEQLRDTARDIKNHALANLDFYLEAYEAKVLESGGKVHWCADAEEARDAVLAICQAADAQDRDQGKVDDRRGDRHQRASGTAWHHAGRNRPGRVYHSVAA